MSWKEFYSEEELVKIAQGDYDAERLVAGHEANRTNAAKGNSAYSDAKANTFMKMNDSGRKKYIDMKSKQDAAYNAIKNNTTMTKAVNSSRGSKADKDYAAGVVRKNTGAGRNVTIPMGIFRNGNIIDKKRLAVKNTGVEKIK